MFELAMQIAAVVLLLIAGGFLIAAAYRGINGIIEARKMLKRWQ